MGDEFKDLLGRIHGTPEPQSKIGEQERKDRADRTLPIMTPAGGGGRRM